MTTHFSLRRNRSMITVLTAALVFLFALYGWTLDIRSLPSSAGQALENHVRYLASDKLAGRAVDSDGITLARDYIGREFAQYGLRPGGDNGGYFQSFDVATGVDVKQPTTLSLGNEAPLPLHEAWVPLGLSDSGALQGEVVFAGYGITVKDYGYDDYAGIDARGKIVLVLRYEPPPKNDQSPFHDGPRYSMHATLRAKANNARDHGAAGMILVDPNSSGDGDKELISMTGSLWRSGNRLIAAQVKRRVIETWLATHGVSLARLKEQIDRQEKPASVSLPGAKVALQVTLEEIHRRADNVIGILPGSDPKLKDEAIVLGAHYDHLGLGRFGTPDAKTEGQIHHGADDNASGTAVLLMLAEQLSRLTTKPARTVIFAAFSAEELGLHGSRYYVNHPAISLSLTKAMLNFDMVGRLRDNRVTVFGARSAPGLSETVNEAAARLGLEVRESDNVGRSDHMSFYNKKIPSLHFFTGSHPDYHRPGDTWEKLHIDGMARVAQLALAVAETIADSKAAMNFVSLASRPPRQDDGEREKGGYGSYLGSIPDFAANQDGVRLAGVSEGSPAALAGLREGDIIVQLQEFKVHDLEDLAAALRSKKPGDEVEITILRSGKPLTVKALLKARG